MDNTSNNYANQFKDLLSAHGLIQHITAPTHRYCHCLDLVITRENTSPLISNITVHPGLSDHYAIITDMNLKKPKMPTISVTTRHWKNVNIQDLCSDFESQLENVNHEDGELHSCVNLFESTVHNIWDDHAPLKTVKLQSEFPWFNDDIHAARKTRRQLEQKWRDNGKREVHRQEYRKHDFVKNMINQAKNSSLLIACGRELWQSRKNSLTFFQSCFMNPKLQCFHPSFFPPSICHSITNTATQGPTL